MVGLILAYGGRVAYDGDCLGRSTLHTQSVARQPSAFLQRPPCPTGVACVAEGDGKCLKGVNQQRGFKLHLPKNLGG